MARRKLSRSGRENRSVSVPPLPVMEIVKDWRRRMIASRNFLLKEAEELVQPKSLRGRRCGKGCQPGGRGGPPAAARISGVKVGGPVAGPIRFGGQESEGEGERRSQRDTAAHPESVLFVPSGRTTRPEGGGCRKMIGDVVEAPGAGSHSLSAGRVAGDRPPIAVVVTGGKSHGLSLSWGCSRRHSSRRFRLRGEESARRDRRSQARTPRPPPILNSSVIVRKPDALPNW